MQYQTIENREVIRTSGFSYVTETNSSLSKIDSFICPEIGIAGTAIDTPIQVFTAKTIEDLDRVFDVRWEGYKKYFESRHEVIDEFDFYPQAILFLAEDVHGQAIGTLRLLDRRFGPIELDKFVEVDSILSYREKACVEATRFSIPNHPDSKMIKLLLWKATLQYCQLNSINTIIQSVRPAAARAYRSLLFDNVGPSGIYNHSLLGNLEHQTYKLNISEKREIMKRNNYPLYKFFFIENHTNITINPSEYLVPESAKFSKIH